MRVNVIYGPPCSGKSTHVVERIGEHDIVYDYDRILSAITARKYHTTDKHAAHQIVIDFRARLLDRLHTAPEIENAFIITRWPTNALMESLAGLAVGRTRIEATKAECYARLDADDTRPDKAEWRLVIDEWFDKYEGADPLARDERSRTMKKFWNWTEAVCQIENENEPRTLRLDGVIAEDSWFEDDVTPAAFKAELEAGSGDIVVWINSPGGDVVAASQIYNMLMEYPHDVTVKIDGMAASAASVIAMAGTRVLMAPTAVMMIHNPLTVAIGDSAEMRKALHMLDEFKDAIMNAYEIKTGMSRTKLSHMMDAETWLSASKAVEMGFADGILYRNDAAPMEAQNMVFSRRAVTNSLLDKLKRKEPTAKEPGNGKISVADLDKRLALLASAAYRL